MKDKFILIFLLFFFGNIDAQSVDFYGKKINTNICNELGFKDNQEANNCLDKICEAADLVNNYVLVPCSNVGTCLATVKDGVYYIMYDNAFLNKVKTLGFTERKIGNKSSTDWSSITIMAHELGHYALAHFNKLINKPEFYLRNEIQADEFAGKTLFKLGATLEQAQLAFLSLSETETLTHPKRADRLNAVAKGYNKEKLKFGNNKTISSSQIVGSWSDDNTNVTMSYFENGSFNIFEKGSILEGEWKINGDKLNIKVKDAPIGVDITIADLSDYTLTLKAGRNNTITILKRISTDAITAMSNYLKKNFDKLVYIDKFSYSSRRIGGISDVNVPVVNNTNYMIDLVKVKVEYVKDAQLASGAVYKTEFIEFDNIKPHERQVIHAPDSDRGTTIRTSITTFRSNALNNLFKKK